MEGYGRGLYHTNFYSNRGDRSGSFHTNLYFILTFSPIALESGFINSNTTTFGLDRFGLHMTFQHKQGYVLQGYVLQGYVLRICITGYVLQDMY